MLLSLILSISLLGITVGSKFARSCANKSCLGNLHAISISRVKSSIQCSLTCEEQTIDLECAAWVIEKEKSNLQCSLYGVDYHSCDIDNIISNCDSKQFIKITCFNGGMFNTDSTTCHCPPNFSGRFCEIDLCPKDICTGHCNNHGKCHCDRGELSCECDEDYTGQKCETEIQKPVSCVGLCQNHGNCGCVLGGGCSCHCVAGFTGEFCSTDSGPVKSLTLDVVDFPLGSWGEMEYCDTGTYAHGFQQRTDTTTNDKTSLCEIKIFCKSPFSGSQSVSIPNSVFTDESWGSWENVVLCPSGYWIVGFRTYVKPFCGNCDDSAANNMEVKCRGPGLNGSSVVTIKGEGTHFSAAWVNWSDTCPSGTAVCGMRTKVEAYQGFWNDDSGLGSVTLQCCKF